MSKSSLKTWWTGKPLKFLRASRRRLLGLPLLAKILLLFLALVATAVVTLFVVIGPSRIAQTMYDFAQDIAELRFGWMILGGVLILTSFPPMIGYTTTVSLTGFAYGVKGFWLAGTGAMIGSALAFIVLRTLFQKRLRIWTAENEKWQALESVVRAKGLPLIILIRSSPLPPWVYANAMFASIEAVKFWQFVVATTFVLPKIFLSVFIGSRIAMFSDGKQRGEMDKTSKIMNGVSIVVGVALAFASAFVLYRLMQKEIRQLRESPDIEDELAADALEEAGEGAPLLRDV